MVVIKRNSNDWAVHVLPDVIESLVNELRKMRLLTGHVIEVDLSNLLSLFLDHSIHVKRNETRHCLRRWLFINQEVWIISTHNLLLQCFQRRERLLEFWIQMLKVMLEVFCDVFFLQTPSCYHKRLLLLINGLSQSLFAWLSRKFWWTWGSLILSFIHTILRMGLDVYDIRTKIRRNLNIILRRHFRIQSLFIGWHLLSASVFIRHRLIHQV